jgi:hypothetical protein
MRSSPIFASLCCLWSVSALTWCSAEDPRWTPCIDIGYAPSVNTVDHTDFTDKGAGSVALGGAMRHHYQDGWGCMAGVAVFDTYGKSNGNAQSVNDITVKTNELGLRIEAGPTYDFTPEWCLALTPYVGLGWAHYVYSGGSASDSDDGAALNYGAKLALHYAISKGYRVGIYGGWEGISARLKNQTTGDKYNAQGSGPVAGLSFGWLF